jgi:hypothetical protein
VPRGACHNAGRGLPEGDPTLQGSAPHYGGKTAVLGEGRKGARLPGCQLARPTRGRHKGGGERRGMKGPRSRAFVTNGLEEDGNKVAPECPVPGRLEHPVGMLILYYVCVSR